MNRQSFFGRRIIPVVCVSSLAFGVVAGCASDEDGQAGQAQESVDLTSAPQAQWSDYSGIKVPKGDAGPHATSPVRFGYEHSPQGAVLAAINTQAQMALADEKSFPEVSKHSLAPSKGRDQWVQGRALAEVHGKLAEADAPKFSGFRIDDYSEDSALVVLAAQYPGVGLMAYPVQLSWMGEDWRVVPAPQDAGISPVGIDSLDGFTQFSAG